jgi:D-amino peptidase
MKIFISADIEGVAGVVHPSQGQPGNGEYERARRLMTDEVSAAIAGAFDAGATSVLVNDSHGPQTNLLPDLLDPRAELLLGRPKQAGMCAGLDASFDAVFFTGYHAGAGQPGVLSHTINGFAFAAIRLNGTDCAEATLYGAYAASHRVPVALLTGDDQLMAQCAGDFPEAQTVVVKHALGHRAARALSPQQACAAIRKGATAALRNLEACRSRPIPGPYRLELDLNTVAIADLAAIIPVADRIGPRTVAFAANEIDDVLGWINTVSVLAGSLR